MNDRLKALYKSVIVRHSNEPVHFAKNESAQYILKASSPICGDRFTIFFDLEGGKFNNLSFYGHGCAVSKASTSILVQHLQNQPIEKALEICKEFYRHLDPDKDPPDPPKEEFEAFSAAKLFPGRMQCATLSWDETAAFLKTQQ